MSRPVEVFISGGVMTVKIRINIDIRTDRAEVLEKIVTDGAKRIEIQSRYEIDGVYLPVKAEIIELERPRFSAVNIRVYEKVPVVRKRYLPWCNVSRTYIGSGRLGVFKLIRRLFGIPDMFINLGGRAIDTERQRIGMESVVQHEFGHVLGFRDKYNYRTMQKRNIKVQDCNIMFRTGQDRRFMDYQIKHLMKAAERGRLPFTQV